MKLATVTNHSEGTALSSNGFEIGDSGVIISYLRDKIYSNPIGTICREIASNSRDAHREVGKSDLPIEITLPTAFNPEIKFRDYGPGISPQRMSTVYVFYGNSTKRDSNEETGGFGLGAKTPFAYAPSFTIRTITPNDEGKNIQRVYSASVGSDRKGGVFLLDERETNEAQGTEISVPVEQDDFKMFSDNVMLYTNYWKVRPVITNVPNFYANVPKDEVIIKSENWEIIKKTNFYNYDQKAIIDGIPYIIELGSVFDKDGKLIRAVENINCILYFNTGDLDLSIGREELNYSKNTKQVLKNAFDSLIKNSIEILAKQLESCETYVKAAEKAREFHISTNIQIAGESLKWKNSRVFTGENGLDIVKRVPDLRLDSFGKEHTGQIVKRTRYLLQFHSNIVFAINDEGNKVFQDSVHNLLDEVGLDKRIQVLVATEGDIKSKIEEIKKIFELDFNDLNPYRLSDYKSKRKVKKIKKKRAVTNCHGFNFVYSRWEPVSLDLKSEKGYYVLLQNRLRDIRLDENLPNCKNFFSRIVSELVNKNKQNDKRVIGIKPSQISKCGPGFKPLLDLVKKEKERLDREVGTLKELYDVLESEESASWERNTGSILQILCPNNHLYISLKETEAKEHQLKDNRNIIVGVHLALGIEAERKATNKLKKIQNQILKEYKILKYLSRYEIRSNPDEAKEIFSNYFKER